MIVLVGNTKGGVGKTTLAVQMAIARARAGRRVWLVDGDSQATAQAAIQIRAEAGLEPEIVCSLYPDGKILRQQVRLQKDNYDDVILDVGGRDTLALRAGLSLADVALVPFAPESFDLWAMQNMADVVDEIGAERDGLVTYAVLNKAEARSASVDNADAAEAVQEIPTFTYLDLPLVKRKAFSSSSGAGMGVAEQSPVDPKAIAELDRLVARVFEEA
ncbi:MAG: chromosome partitioning protein ParA [Methylobacterium sp. CG08_land_8_20_14_0_20_71_15]|jgi:chromosome partitioning protein|uniref:Iron-sulfur cluster carrier protein n=2 Tax=Methylobacteriaceae TaxID=119045 RepID=A0ABQ4SUS7_9HYPH|nr:MAG: chromosome partitioning protein ParA [Methylobacterium sp. CG09_land_8_20_14_0_10_71_15]PIU12381.1 MAG: chromosome partitioning protein ParA [Methylobacterium sp. CG08_land_8_20_14_0_20_71_15]GBU16893.1 partitioning protein ParA [Methylobacterium sp.]GJE06847.1 Iron-sulfur cluster carrier protein [Methylobacterium jeotgali]